MHIYKEGCGQAAEMDPTSQSAKLLICLDLEHETITGPLVESSIAVPMLIKHLDGEWVEDSM